MAVNLVPAGKNPPDDLYAVIEIPAHAVHIKYEIDKETGELFVDRFMPTPMFMPTHYGYIPQSLGDDGDPLDVLLMTDVPVVPRCVVRCRPVGVLKMEDESGGDEKILCVPHTKLDRRFEKVTDIDHVEPLLKEQIRHFYENYKALEPGKWVKVKGWGTAAEARAMIEKALTKAKSEKVA